MPDEKFKLPQSSYEELTKVVKAYGHFSEPAGLDEVSKFIGLHPTVISRNAGFLTAIGILQSGAKKAPTQMGRELAHALEHNMPDEIRSWWRRVVTENDFLVRLMSAIRIRNGMDQQTLEAHIAYSAGQPKRPQFMTGARTVIDILRAAEVIREVDGKYVSDHFAGSPQEGPLATPLIPPKASESSLVQTIHSPATHVPGTLPSISVTLQINVNCSVGEISGLADELEALIKKMSKLPSDK